MDRNPVNNMLALLCSNFRAELDSYQKRAYVRALDGIAGDVLLAAADLLIDEGAGGRKFYPLPNASDVKGACAKVMSDRRKQAAALHLSSCDHNSHWVEVDGKLQRCPCWQMAQHAMASVGQAIALPASREEQVEA